MDTHTSHDSVWVLTFALDVVIFICLDFTQVDGDTNPKLQSIDIERVSLWMAKFTSDGQEIIGIGMRQGFFVYDIGTGKVTRINLKGT